MFPWEIRLASHEHAVVFQFLDIGEMPMAMENLVTVMPIYRNPGRPDMADTPEAGTDVQSRGLNGHVAEGYVVAHMSVELARRKVSEGQMMSSLVLRVVTEAPGC